MIIKNARVFTEDAAFVQKDILIEDGVFTEQAGGQTIDAAGCYAIPGLVDIHFHGCVGYDFCDGTHEAITAIARYQAKNGVTAICPATMTLPEPMLETVCRAAASWKPGPDCAALVGINMEGPFVSLEKCGAQNPAYIHAPDADMFRRLQHASGGLIRLLAVAPETDGALDMIRALDGEVLCSIAHTTAGYDLAAEAIAAGARHITHLYNAMPPLSHRAPGVIGAASDAQDCEAELIADGVHIHPSAVRAAFRLFGNGGRIILISDSMMATGLSDGDYSLGGQAVKVVGNRATLESGTIAGSATNLMDCMRTAVRDMHIPLETAVKCAAANPARSIGVYDRHGSIAPGKAANVVLLDDKLEIQSIVLNGAVL
ncbi:N-acetylglucosamine-6-phosphate deacetylase [Anaerotruncus colihominis]|uniref:N-acetylglucosamine-6-phosphate deacetylase n=1 Tax=Anaerotruncus colihominis TaxID=169435 RepID=UPI000B3A44B9|nr:N-acetylglucosamine-6-phosphate deacetylase [Anaerotruncus colihominis]OUP71984.1 N-acetylglucosamine-6-phosphate deacetylase [Anaerotruncus colihominis]